jgi:hypothetical protein
MAFPWSGKKGPTDAEGAELFPPYVDPDVAKTPGGRVAPAEGPGGLGQLLGKINEQVVAYLAHRESQGGEGGPVAELARKIDSLAQRLDQVASGRGAGVEGPPALPGVQAAAKAPAGGVQEVLDRLEKKLNAIAEGRAGAPVPPAPGADAATADAIRRLQHQIEDGFAQLAERLAPAKKTSEAVRPATSADWERAILGAGLASNPALDFQRQQLLRGVLDADPAACSLAGQLLVFQSATAERMPQLLKDIGEAFYRWQPKTHSGANPMEQALVDWLKSVCDQAGIGNTIELVHPGERFDSTRHNATTRGVEIAEVQGWIVLRDTGKVYTKANVAAR